MDTTTKIIMRILNDACQSENGILMANYASYYESLDANQSKTVVSDAIKKLVKENGNASCDFGEDSFTLTI